ncbi:uncharacterized protein LOC125030010 [Penaeus chinensis]|uniref:uncharacterized protein LOC125030010 n=1 Tax=Penaeus chinensis TaxID=139456 RepID=UPI001FB6F5B7|nr:uncharacterized protein LOC125030010 [Penaeus chinensis]
MDVYIKCGCYSRLVRVNHEDTVANVKYKIEKRFAFRTVKRRFEPGLPFLLYRILDKLFFSFVQSGSCRKSYQGFEVSIVKPFFEIIRIAVDAHTYILDLKHEIASSSGVEVSRQILRAGSQVMRDEKMLKDYGIEDHSVLWLEFQSSRKYSVLLEGAAAFILGIGVFLQLRLWFFLFPVIECIGDMVM